MMQKQYLLIIIIVLSLIVVGCSTLTGTGVKTYPSTSNFDSYTIHELKQKNTTEGSYNVEGFVVLIYTCPSCPIGSLCKPCMVNNIVISEDSKRSDAYSLTEKDLIVFTPDSNPKQFEVGKKYRFSINITKHKSTGEPLNDIELIGYDTIQ